ncbi:MAG: molybdopterin-guanine dinucleotide biosynthesis protein A [Alteromonadaceae bacterium]|jgi:molybdopterin-guanine dinucleotide biosynthesis protein A
MSNSPFLPTNSCEPYGEQHSTCLGVVLSGGLSSRMGKDKSALMRNNIDMLSYSKQLLTGAGIKQVVISASHQEVSSGEHATSNTVVNNNLINSDLINNDCVEDVFKNAGPLGGIYSIIKRYRPTALLVLPVDLPLMDSPSLTKLKQIGELSHKACFYENNYLPLYLPVNAFVEQFLHHSFSVNINSSDNKQRSIRALLKQIPSQEVAIDSPKVLFNSNTPEQWQYLKSNAFNLTPTQFESINHHTLPSRKSYV